MINGLLERMQQLKNSQKEEMHRAKYGGEGVQSFHALPRHATLPACQCVLQLSSSPNPTVRGFVWSFIAQAWLVTSVAIGD